MMKVLDHNYSPKTALIELDGKILEIPNSNFEPPDLYSSNSSSSFRDSTSSIYPSIVDTYASKNVDNYLKAIKSLEEEKEAWKVKIDLLEIQLKFALSKLDEIEKLLENKND